MATEEVFIGRQPILDRDQKMFAYELLFRSGSQKNSADVQDNLAASASVISHAFGDLGIDQALGPYKGFINCDEELLLSDIIEILPTDKIVLEVLETVEVTPPIVGRCRELKARGFTLALDDFVNYEEKWRPLLDLVEIVKVDIMPLDTASLARTTVALRRWPLMLLAEKVDSREQAGFCHDLGYTLFQGYYFAKPVIIAGRKLGHSRLSLMRLLGLVLEDAETTQLEGVFKHEPGLAMNLLRLTNSVATGVRTRVTSLRHAVTILGRRQLQRWLQLLLYTNPSGGDVASPLLQLAATRGRLMELLAGGLHPGQREIGDHAFMTGIMSLMPTLMGVGIGEILKGINLTGDVREALESRGGELGTMLRLTEALEAGDGAACHDLTGQLAGADHTVINACLAQALAWANNIGRMNE
ncbi:MAG: EAL domain-containing protein [Candidatus Nitricoxidivorans perseverans]|uniref:EAL domain-containing protein n=1 Tax=Candidatus Nitricoxidivorans perseverans TaxID=2975601 RepID=A0AA49FNN3_9PROT|nr:MAG: EAL domain-containing protein [Candidatus Nitricoxidivorans perseverans]